MYEFDNMINNLPAAYRKDKWVNDLLNSITLADQGIRDKAAEMAAQILLDSMTYNMPTEEYIAGVEVKPGSSVEDRKNILSAKWQSVVGKCDIELIRQVCRAWDKGDTDAVYDGPEAAVTLRFIYKEHPGTYDTLLSSMYDMLRRVIPAHLLMNFNVQAAEVKNTVHIGGAACGGYSRITLPVIEPDRSVKDKVKVYGVSAVRSSSVLSELDPYRQVSADIDTGFTQYNVSSRTTIQQIGGDQNG